MTQKGDVNGSDSSTEEDERGVPIKNLQAEMTRKIAEMDAKNAERFEALTQRLEALATPAEETHEVETITVDEREELKRISAAPRRYVDSFVQPIKEDNEKLRKEVEQTKLLFARTLWEKQEEKIARMEGKKEWSELPSEIQKGVIDIVKEKGWGNNPSSAVDAYELLKMRKAKEEAADPDRAARIAASTTEGSGRQSGKTAVRTISRSSLDSLTSTHPRHPDYRKNMETLGRVQSGEIKVE